jgi:hypothetical protein
MAGFSRPRFRDPEFGEADKTILCSRLFMRFLC